MKIEIHQIQNFAPSCLNRDDTNTPKSCQFGGRRRARISSQCLKRAMRLHMREHSSIPTGVRTRLLVSEMAKLLAARGRDAEQATQAARKALAAVPMKFEKDDSLRTCVGLYLADEEIAALAEAVGQDWDKLAADKVERKNLPAVSAAVEAIGKTVAAADVALFGRMVAESTNMNVDAACQVAHAISTHAVEAEMDFFTAVDDLQPEQDPGAGMMGIVEFNSACFYRYAVIDREQLAANLRGDGDLADRAIVGFVEASMDALPTGRQNSSAAQNPPDYVEVVVNDGLPRSLANAFEEAVRPNGSLVGASVRKLRGYADKLDSVYGGDGLRRQFLTTVEGFEGGVSRAEMLRWLSTELKEGA